MKRTIVALLACCALTVTVARAQRNDDDADRRAIAALITEVRDANNGGDVERWVGLFAPDFVYMAPGAPAVTDRAALREVARAGFQHAAAIDIVPAEIEVQGDWAFARTHVTGTVTLHGSGRVVEVDTKQLAIYRRLDTGSWRIARLISNGNRP